MDDKELTKSLNKVKISLMTKKNAVFLTTIIFSLKLKWDSKVESKSSSVDGKEITINPEYWEGLSLEARMALLAHSAWHVAFNHMFTPKGLCPVKWNIAADYVVNCLLKESGFILPPGSRYNRNFVDMSTREVYDFIVDNPDNPDNNNNNIGLSNDLASPPSGKDKRKKLKHDISRIINRAKVAKEAEDRNSNGHSAGDIPGEIDILLDELNNPKLPWQTILQNYMSAFQANDYTYARINRRFLPHGFLLPTLYSENLGEIAIAVDTSGSVSDDDFKSFIAEINDIKTRMKPLITTIIDFDTSIKHVHTLGPEDNVTSLPFSGRGGTDLDCVFEYYNKRKPEVLIVFSDLYCSEIEEDPGYPVIWVCVDNKNAGVNFGELIHYSTTGE